MIVSQKYKLPNPLKPDEIITQEVIVGDSPSYDYSSVPWVAIDTEFLGLSIEHSQLCVVQIASPDPEAPESRQRVEIIWVWERIKNNDADLQRFFRDMLNREDLQIIMHVSTADLPRIEILANTDFKGKLFDTKVAGKISVTNSSNHGMDDLIKGLINPNFQKNREETSAQWDLHPLSWTDKMIEYAMGDVYYLNALKVNLEKMAERRGQTEILEVAMKAMPAVCKLYRAGYNVSVFTY